MNTYTSHSASDDKATNTNWLVVYDPCDELIVSLGITSTSTDSAASAAKPEPVPSIRKLCSR